MDHRIGFQVLFFLIAKTFLGVHAQAMLLNQERAVANWGDSIFDAEIRSDLELTLPEELLSDSSKVDFLKRDSRVGEQARVVTVRPTNDSRGKLQFSPLKSGARVQDLSFSYSSRDAETVFLETENDFLQEMNYFAESKQTEKSLTLDVSVPLLSGKVSYGVASTAGIRISLAMTRSTLVGVLKESSSFRFFTIQAAKSGQRILVPRSDVRGKLYIKCDMSLETSLERGYGGKLEAAYDFAPIIGGSLSAGAEYMTKHVSETGFTIPGIGSLDYTLLEESEAFAGRKFDLSGYVSMCQKKFTVKRLYEMWDSIKGFYAEDFQHLIYSPRSQENLCSNIGEKWHRFATWHGEAAECMQLQNQPTGVGAKRHVSVRKGGACYLFQDGDQNQATDQQFFKDSDGDWIPNKPTGAHPYKVGQHSAAHFCSPRLGLRCSYRGLDILGRWKGKCVDEAAYQGALSAGKMRW